MPLKTANGAPAAVRKGRGAALNPEGRFETVMRIAEESPVSSDDTPALETTVTPEVARSIISRNQSPDVVFAQSINPYRGCEHGCIYCYARPTHGYLGLSPGLDFETRLFAKTNAALLLREALSRPGYRCEPLALGANTDPYQPVEKEWRLTRQVLEVLSEFRHPVLIITKSALVERDLDILEPMAQANLVQVFISLSTLDSAIARRLEPRAAAPARRLQTLAKLQDAGVPTGVLVAPVIPFLTDSELEAILAAARSQGAAQADYTLLRLPFEVKELFKDWLNNHYPLKAEHVMSRVREMREGRENDPDFGSRMRGAGVVAQLLARRFEVACQRLGFNRRKIALDNRHFRPPRPGQLSLF